uniref:probable 2-oxoglutarate-dependent dioxygenase AOP1 n=1 Tax=Erigeron canadensis TaxID=72917 RepID=UPI001CB9B647|nr:probable 2-oxoglutarate-dependent dioxygenase AOP1 [Erigeron canadensis]
MLINSSSHTRSITKMGSEAAIQLPKIDFSQISSDNLHDLSIWESVKADVFKAFQEYGCFEVSSFVSIELQETVYDDLKHLFDLPLETKRRNTSDIAFHGYVQSPKVPLYESMGIGNPFIPENVDNFSNLMWPDQDNPKFRESMKSYSKKLRELDEIVKKMVFQCLDLERYLEDQMNSTSYLLKLMKYRAPEPNESDIGLHTHTDTNIMTILHQDEIGGLEILTKNDEWIRVNAAPNSFVIVAGESLNVWLNGRVHVPFHRVVMTGNMARYSLGFFSVQKATSLVKAFDEMVDEEHPLLYKPFNYGEFLKFFYKEGGIKSKFALKTYCGVEN